MFVNRQVRYQTPPCKWAVTLVIADALLIFLEGVYVVMNGFAHFITVRVRDPDRCLRYALQKMVSSWTSAVDCRSIWSCMRVLSPCVLSPVSSVPQVCAKICVRLWFRLHRKLLFVQLVEAMIVFPAQENTDYPKIMSHVESLLISLCAGCMLASIKILIKSSLTL